MSREAHPALPEFEYIKPGSLSDAAAFLAEHAGEARALSGGTDIFVRMRDGAFKDKYLVDIKGLAGTDEIVFDPKRGLVIGAAVTIGKNRLVDTDVPDGIVWNPTNNPPDPEDCL